MTGSRKWEVNSSINCTSVLKMEVSTEEAQAVLLEGMEGTQYIAIQRDGESLGKGVPLLTLNGELISEGMVVDMFDTSGTDYASATQYYETEDLLPHELTEEDKKLAAALVQVQLQQQQKQQQLHNQSQTEETLPDVSHLESLTPINTYSLQTVTSNTPVYPSLQPFKRSHNVKQEQVNVKSEYEVDVSADSGEDITPNSGPKRSLPHKKRIARKLKQQTKKTSSKRDVKINETVNVELVVDANITAFKCEICGGRYNSQLKFFEHLKGHYEPVKQETGIARGNTISVPTVQTVQTIETSVAEEFSEPEDFMEGIRNVVEETGAHIDDDSESQLSTVNTESPLWSMSETPERPDKDSTKSNVIHEQGDIIKDKEVPQTSKKKKPSKPRKQNESELTCPQCDRTFHHKNSLVYHMRSHNGERPHQCEVCGKSFFAASALKVHKRLHSGDKPYKCEACGRNFRQWGDLKYHSMSIHSEHRQYQCEYCGKDFARKYSLIVHRRIHTGEKNYRCEYCTKTFRASSYLQNHRRIHTGEKPHPCTVCGKPFRVRSDMKRHMHTHTHIPRKPADRITVNVTTNATKTIEDEEERRKQTQAKTIQDLVRGLKLEVDANGVVEIVPPDDNPESILPHSGSQTLEYTVTNSSDGTGDRDPLDVVRTTDNMQYFFI